MSRLDTRAATLPGVLAQAAKTRPEACVLREAGRAWTNAALLHEVRRAAKAFIAAGLAKGERFAIWAPNSAAWIIATLGGQMAGGVLVPLNTRYKAGEAGDILARSKARLLFTVRGFLGTDYKALLKDQQLPDLRAVIDLADPGEEGWAAFLETGNAVSDEACDACFEALTPACLSDILFTSGTTGRPKGAMTSHGQNVAVYTEWAKAVGLEEGDVYLIANPFFHAFGYKAGWLAALIGGAQILPHAVFDAEEVLKRIAEERVSVLPGPPTIFQSLINHPRLGAYDLSSLKRTITGAASVPEQLVLDMKTILGFETVLTGYGLTETSGTVSLSRRGEDIHTIAHFSGRPLPGVEVRIVDPAGVEAAPGEPGEIWVRGFNVMAGYLDDAAATAQTITPEGWLKTGDIGIQDPRGYLKITDRCKDMFITGGFNCYPAEIENILLSHPDLLDVAVVGVPDERLGEVGCAHVVLKPGARLSGPELIAWARDQMANFKVPRHVAFHAQLPRNAGGKVQKFALRALSDPPNA